MSDDKTILAALQFEPMSGSDIGKGFAPENIKDRAGWGRKWLKRARESGLVQAVGDLWAAAGRKRQRKDAVPYNGLDYTRAMVASGGLNVAQSFLQLIMPDSTGRDYKAPHANRGTPSRPHFPRTSRAIRFCNH
jgi:hypothetical protein